jgi:hypothetical protein
MKDVLTKLSSGSLARVQVPFTMSGPFIEFHPNWIKFAEANDEKTVRLVKPRLMFHAPHGSWSEESFEGWDVESYQNIDGIRPGPDCASWFPAEWLVPASNQKSLFPEHK